MVMMMRGTPPSGDLKASLGGEINEGRRLILPETKAVYGVLVSHLSSALAFLLKGYLVAFEDWIIGWRARNAVDAAVEEYEILSPPHPQVPPPVYSEGGPGFFDYMELRAPWYEPMQEL